MHMQARDITYMARLLVHIRIYLTRYELNTTYNSIDRAYIYDVYFNIKWFHFFLEAKTSWIKIL